LRSGCGDDRSVVVNDANVGLFPLRRERGDDLHGNSPSFFRVPSPGNCKLDLVTGGIPAAPAVVSLCELDESPNLRCRMHLQFHEGSIGSRAKRSERRRTGSRGACGGPVEESGRNINAETTGLAAEQPANPLS
jgi:hypothetical protein